MFGYLLLVSAALALATNADDGEIAISNDKSDCVNKMVQWCKNMNYPQEGAGISMMSINYEDPNGMYNVLCVSDSDGTNCTRNRNAWFSCSPDNKFSYKGKPLTENSTDVDDDICSTADKALNDMFVQNLSYNTTTLKEEMQNSMQSFFEQMVAMQEQIDAMRTLIQNLFPPPSFVNDIYESDDSVNATTLGPTVTNSTAMPKAGP